MLVDAGADVEIKDSKGRTPLERAQQVLRREQKQKDDPRITLPVGYYDKCVKMVKLLEDAGAKGADNEK